VTTEKKLKKLAFLVYTEGDQKEHKSLLCKMSVFKWQWSPACHNFQSRTRKSIECVTEVI